jgi:prepilin-type N-terminal cleavage/methylation domain-containing protein
MQKRAFSLIELMIVIVIIGVVYSLALSRIKTPTQKSQPLSFLTLKSYLLGFSKDHKSVELLCEKSCDKCVILSDGKELAEVKSFFDKSVEFYRYDFFLGDVALNRESCFDFSIDGDGVSDQVIIVYKDKVYDYTPYFTDVVEYDSLEKLKDAKEERISAVQ